MKYSKANYTTEMFIERARRVHGDVYDYTDVEYRGSALKVWIRCPKHGSFLKSPNAHVSGKQGCPKCGQESLRISRKTSDPIARIYKNKAIFDGCSFPIRKIVHNNRSYIFSIKALERVLWQGDAYVSQQAEKLCAKIYGYLDTATILRHSTVQELITFIEGAHNGK